MDSSSSRCAVQILRRLNEQSVERGNTVEAKARRNPYIIGRAIYEQEKFYGRESLFGVIEDNLNQGVKVILLHGQRRIGKSSVLKQIPNFIARDEFVFVPFDLQHKNQSPLSDILHNLAKEIVEHLQLERDGLQLPSIEDLENNPDVFSRRFLPKIYQALGDKNLVLLLDEFDVLSQDNPNINIVEQGVGFFRYLAGLVKQQEKLFIIPVVGRYLNDMPNLLKLFKEAPYQEIGLLSEDSARRLITNPAEGVLTYEQEAIKAILKLSAGHPYFTQVICFTLFSQARNENHWTVTSADVEGIADRVFRDDNAQAGLAWFWDGLPISEQVVFCAVAAAHKIAIEQARPIPEEPLTLLENSGIIPTELLDRAARQLAEKGFLDDTERKVKIELVRRWLVQCHPLRQEIRQLEKLEQENVSRLSTVAISLHQQNKQQNALELYEQALAINPNHFSTVLSLAKGYLEVENFDRALELYTRAYQFDQVCNIEELLDALEIYGHKLITQREFAIAKKQFQRVLDIQPDRVLAQQKLKEIAVYESGSVPISETNNTRQRGHPQILQRSIAAVVAAAIATVVGVGFGVYRFAAPCPAGEQKENGFFCLADTSRISRGDRTFFPNPKNTNRDQGIEAFKKGNYTDAVQFFEKAVAANRKDPEVLIYYNNSLARQKGSPLTLATVVPVDHNSESAQEMLRGVAQAQNQFNKKRGFNGRLLEIVIANDGDEPDKAKQVAQQLVKDLSVWGVIGHYSSEATRAALAEYEKADLAIISPTTSSSVLWSNVFFRTVPSNEFAGKTLAEYAATKLSLKRVVIFFNLDSNYSTSMREEFKKHFEHESLGGKVVRPSINLTSPILNVEIEVERSVYKYTAQAGVLFPDTLHTDVALKIAKANKKLIAQGNRGLMLLGGSSLYGDEELQKGGDAVEGLIIEVPWVRQVPQAKDFAQKARQQWGVDVNWRTATSFDATQAFIKSLSSSLKSSKPRENVLQGLPNVDLPASETSGYRLKFQDREPYQPKIFIVKVKNGKFDLVPEQ